MFFNALEIEKMEKNHYLFYEPGKEIPFAVETYRIKGNFRENLELWDFPLDYQVLYLNLFFLLFFCLVTDCLSTTHELCSLFGQCFCVLLPSTHHSRPVGRSLLQKVHNDTSMACDWYISIRPLNDLI